MMRCTLSELTMAILCKLVYVFVVHAKTGAAYRVSLSDMLAADRVVERAGGQGRGSQSEGSWRAGILTVGSASVGRIDG
jgi:hypothetical protein